MKKADLKKCAYCGKGVMHDGCPIFYRVRIERMGIDVGAVRRHHGLELMLNSPALAAVMGPDEDLAKMLGDPVSAIVCLSCSTSASVAAIDEIA